MFRGAFDRGGGVALVLWGKFTGEVRVVLRGGWLVGGVRVE